MSLLAYLPVTSPYLLLIPLVKHQDPPHRPFSPPLPTNYCSPLTLLTLYILLVSRLPTTVEARETSLTYPLQQAPTNAWLAAPDSAQAGGLAPEELLL